MKVAIAGCEGKVFEHFGHCKNFTVFEIENERIINKIIIDTDKSGHEEIVNVLDENKVDILICGGIGSGAKSVLRQKRVEIISGVAGDIDDVIIKYLSGQELGNNEYECTHQHGEETHSCSCVK